MSFNTDPIHGEWWIADDGLKRLEDFQVIKRNNRRLRIQRSLDYNYRVYKNRTDGSDGGIQDPDSEELWDDPVEGAPTSCTDWLVSGAEVSFDLDTGMTEMVVSAVKFPIDWEDSKVISRREFM